MAHFAQVDSTDTVIKIIVIPDEQEHFGQEYISNNLGLPGEWIQCSYNGSIRRRYPGKGYSYDRINDVFLEPRPAASWTLDEDFVWQPPTPKPDSNRNWYWDEATLQWRDQFISPDKITPVVILGED